jgi:hypothetical protein
MTQKTRVLIAVIILILVVGVIFTVDAIQCYQIENNSPGNVPAGSIPVFLDGILVANITQDDFEPLETVSFIDNEEGKTQEGWLLGEVILLVHPDQTLRPESEITVSSASRGKTVTLSWLDVANQDNMVILDTSSRGTLKLASRLEGFDTRDSWVQDIDKIEITTPSP